MCSLSWNADLKNREKSANEGIHESQLCLKNRTTTLTSYCNGRTQCRMCPMNKEDSWANLPLASTKKKNAHESCSSATDAWTKWACFDMYDMSGPCINNLNSCAPCHQKILLQVQSLTRVQRMLPVHHLSLPLFSRITLHNGTMGLL